MKYWQIKSLESKHCFGSHSTQARIMAKFFPNCDRCSTELATHRLAKRKARLRKKSH